MRRAAAFTLLCACTSDGAAPHTPATSTGAESSGPSMQTDVPPPPTSDDDTSGVGFVGNSEVGANNECSTYKQDCPEDEKCMPWANNGGTSWNATKCTPLDANPADLGDPCTVEESGVSGVDNCKRHTMCWNVDPETLEGECIGLCMGSEFEPTCEDDFAACETTSDGTLSLCVSPCHPLDQDCSPGNTCIPDDDDFSCIFLPDEDEVGVYGDPCEYANACALGLYCADATVVPGCEGPQGCCQHFCDLEQPAATQCIGYPLEDCLPWYDEGEAPYPQYETLGACAIPSP